MCVALLWVVERSYAVPLVPRYTPSNDLRTPNSFLRDPFSNNHGSFCSLQGLSGIGDCQEIVVVVKVHLTLGASS